MHNVGWDGWLCGNFTKHICALLTAYWLKKFIKTKSEMEEETTKFQIARKLPT